MAHEEWKRAFDVAQQLYGDRQHMDMTQFAQSEAEFLKAADIKGKNVKVTIAAVKTHTFPANDKNPEQTKPVLYFEGKEKGCVLNPSNTKMLIERYGKNSNGWMGREIGLTTKHYEGFGDGIVVVILDVPFDEGADF